MCSASRQEPSTCTLEPNECVDGAPNSSIEEKQCMHAIVVDFIYVWMVVLLLITVIIYCHLRIKTCLCFIVYFSCNFICKVDQSVKIYTWRHHSQGGNENVVKLFVSVVYHSSVIVVFGLGFSLYSPSNIFNTIFSPKLHIFRLLIFESYIIHTDHYIYHEQVIVDLLICWCEKIFSNQLSYHSIYWINFDRLTWKMVVTSMNILYL